MAGDGDEEAAVNIHIRIPFPSGERFSVVVNLNWSAEELKAVVAERCGIPAERQRLIYNGRLMQGGRTLENFGVEENEIIHLVRCSVNVEAAETERLLAVYRSDPVAEIWYSVSSDEEFHRMLSMHLSQDQMNAALLQIKLIFSEDNRALFYFLSRTDLDQNSAAAAAVDQEVYVAYVTQLSQILQEDLGFNDIQENIRALAATAGNVRAAVRRLLDIRHNLRSF